MRGMLSSRLSAEVFLAALAVLSSAGCTSEKSSSKATAEPTPPPVTATPAAEPSPAPADAPTASAPRALNQPNTGTALSAGGVDAGRELKKPTAPAAGDKNGASAACGANGCSPEMKKGK